MEYSFNTQLAKEYKSSDIAIFIKNFDFWLSKTKANNKNYHDGCYWTYNSVEAFSRLFDWLTPDQIRRLLIKMESLNILQTSNYNKIKYDRTKWYTFTKAFCKKYNSILRFCQMEVEEKPNRIDENLEPIPDNNTYNKPDIKPYISVKNKKESDTRVKIIHDKFLELHPNKNEYIPNYPKERKLIKGLLDQVAQNGKSEKIILDRMKMFFKNDFYEKVNYNLGTFVKNFNTFVEKKEYESNIRYLN